MTLHKFQQPRFILGRLLILFTAVFVAAGLLLAQAPQMASATRFNPPDDGDEIDPGGFQPPANGFSWSVPVRYGLDGNGDGMVDTFWRAGSIDYDPTYIYPDSWRMDFYGCQTDDDALGEGSNTYQWNVNGTITTAGCSFTTFFDMQGTYPVTLTVTYSDSTSSVFPQEVYIKDYLIVAIGDSLASGEGNPDVPQHVSNITGLPDADPRWQDKRCHRSADAYPSQAAMAMEFSDPHTSVTFISFACSGATILTPAWDPVGLQWGWPPLNINPDPSKYRGIGILGPYIGNEWDNYAIGSFIPSQMQQLQSALDQSRTQPRRQIDALIMSAGGNDLHFGDIAMTCLFEDNCWPNKMVHETPNTSYNMSALVSRALTPAAQNGSPTSLPDGYAALDAAIDAIEPQPPANVYITQYADQTRGDVPSDLSPRYCSVIDDIFWPLTYGATPSESMPLSINALDGMNHAILDAANLWGWKYVDGISSYEVQPGKTPGSPGLFVRDEYGNGHGYCAGDNWIVRADESVWIQGPLVRLTTKGTLHPNAKGIQVLKDRLLYYMEPDLEATNPGNPPGNPPTFSSSLTSDGLTSQPGANGWYTHSCDSSQNCSYSQVVLQVTATGSDPLEAASMYLNDQEGCNMPGVTCRRDVFTASNQVQWNFSFTADGTYQMQFSVRDTHDQVASYVSEIKVDLHDPQFSPLPGPFTVDEGSSVTLSAAASDAMSQVLDIDWDLDNDGIFETTGEQPSFAAEQLDGPSSQTIQVRVSDAAGRTASAETSVDIANIAPSVVIEGAPLESEEGTKISLTSDVSDPGANESFTYAWEVKKDGSAFTTGAEAGLSFTPDGPGSYEVNLSVSDDDSGVGTAASQTIKVTNAVPALSNIDVPTSANEAASFTISADITHPKTPDTFELTVDWGDGSAAEHATLPTGSTGFSLDHTYADDNPTSTASDIYQLSISIEDEHGGIGSESASIVVYNLPPSVSITSPDNGALYAINTAVSLKGSLTDASALDTLACSINWGDGATQTGTLSAGICTASHAYSAAGVYTIQMTGADDDLGTTTKSLMAVVYDPSAGFVTGGGWIDSAAGAYKADVSLAGRASFGFVSKYQKGQTIPTGNTAFNFEMAGLSFASQSYEWLVVNQNGTNAQFKGTGKINGLLDPNGQAYHFMVWAGDGSPDTFQIKIWWEDANGEHVVYENSVNQALGGGSIVVHTSK